MKCTLKIREVLAAKRKQLTKLGLRNKQNATRPTLEAIEVDKLFEEDYFGIKSPFILQRALWWNLTNHFGFRAREESRKLCYGDVKLSRENGRKYLE